ncbi:MAG: amidohydrolase [Chloroflexi bacterium]|nr:amidohydrolase [Chloroflexota bacterium]
MEPRQVETQSQALKSAASKAIDKARDDIIGLARAVYASPEAGFEENATSALVAEKLESLGLSVRRRVALTGVKAVRRFAAASPTVGIIGELDAVRVPAHRGAAASTGAAHACGHHAQLGMLYGAAIGLDLPEIASALSGSVAFIATPAEEFIDVERRLARREAGEIQFLSGKQEMIRLGAFDDVDMAMIVHTSSEEPVGRFIVGGTSNGHLVQHVRFTGRAAHAGGAPHEGINALQAAMLAMTAINTQRETFEEKDVVRVHGIITRGGTSVNSVPGEAAYEGRVRGRDMAAVDRIAPRIERCFKAGALALGCAVDITSIPGYMPLLNDPGLDEVFAENAKALVGPGSVARQPYDETRGGSTDMGDLSHLIPVAHPYVTAANGVAHGADYEVVDYDLAAVIPAKVIAGTVIDLLVDGARLANAVKQKHRPALRKVDYIRLQAERFRITHYKPAEG